MVSGYNAGVWGIALSVTGHAFPASGLCLQKIVHRKIAVDPSQVWHERHTLPTTFWTALLPCLNVGTFIQACNLPHRSDLCCHRRTS